MPSILAKICGLWTVLASQEFQELNEEEENNNTN